MLNGNNAESIKNTDYSVAFSCENNGKEYFFGDRNKKPAARTKTIVKSASVCGKKDMREKCIAVNYKTDRSNAAKFMAEKCIAEI